MSVFGQEVVWCVQGIEVSKQRKRERRLLEDTGEVGGGEATRGLYPEVWGPWWHSEPDNDITQGCACKRSLLALWGC